MMQLVSILGAALILGAYAGNQIGWTGTASLSYQLANLVGALLLLVVAVIDARLGFILLEAAWAVVSAWGIAKIARLRTSVTP